MIIKTKPSKAIYDYLNRKPIVNENIIGVIENEAEAEIYVDDEKSPGGVLVRYKYFNYIYTENDSFLDEILETLFPVGFYGFSGVYRPLAEKIRQRYLVNWESRCSLYYLKEGRLDTSLIKSPVQPVDIKDAETINEFYTYRDEESLEKIQKDIKYRPSSAVYIDGEPVCWVLVHNDNSLGIMYTRENHRGKGYAVDVTLDLADKVLERGKVPFLQIVEGNNMSPGLAAKCGFEKIGYADWFGIIVGMPQEIIDGGNQGRYSFLKTLGEVKELEDVKLLHTGVKGYNLVYDIKFEGENAEDRVKEIIEGYSRLDEDFIWDIDGRDEPEQLVNALQNRGLRLLETKNCMHLPMDLFKTDWRRVEGFEVEQAEGIEAIELWCDTFRKGVESDNQEATAFRQMIINAMNNENNKLELYLGKVNGNPVSTAAMNKFDYNDWNASFITVIPEMKEKGLIKAAVAETIKKAQRPEMGWLTVQIAEDYVGAMEEIGFVHSHYLRSYGR